MRRGIVLQVTSLDRVLLALLVIPAPPHPNPLDCGGLL